MTTILAPNRWQQFQKQADLTEKQVEQFKTYLDLLLKRNNEIDLTAITEPDNILDYHFLDSLVLDKFTDLSSIQMLADIGTGAGFPALPLKIKQPHLKMVLIEVTHKRIEFLQEVIAELGLTNIEICDLDWRTFLRKTHYPIDTFVTRAAVEPAELLRMFKPASPYNKAQLVYWASKEWQPTTTEKSYLADEYPYTVGARKRKLILFYEKKAQLDTQ